MNTTSGSFPYINSILLSLFLLSVTNAETATRYIDTTFTTIKITKNIKYGQNLTLSGYNEYLYLDLYEPKNDTITSRPLVIWIHGGSLVVGNKSGMAKYCEEFAKRGYVCASVNYRLGIDTPKCLKTIQEALLRAVQDTKAAVRFLRAGYWTYGIDTSRIYLGGYSAGSMIALHYAYWDQDEIPADLDQSKWGDIEGTSGCPGYSTSIKGIINFCGGITDTTWIEAGDVPAACFHGLKDMLVPAEYGISTCFGIMLYGGVTVCRCADRNNIFNLGAFFPDIEHDIDENVILLDSLIKTSAAFLYSLIKKITDVITIPDIPARGFFLSQNYPNPFNPVTKIEFRIPSEADVSLRIYTILGQMVTTLVSDKYLPGDYASEFNGSHLPSTIYIYNYSVRI